MRYLFGFLCVCALGLMPVVGCSETEGTGGSGGVAGTAASLGSCEWGGTEDCSPSEAPGLIAAGALVTVGGIGGTIASGVLLRRGKRDRDRFREAHYGRLHRVQWDLTRSRLVF